MARSMETLTSLSLKVMTGIFPVIFLVHYSSVKNWSRASTVFALSPITGFLGALIFHKFIDGNVPLIAPWAAVTAGVIGGWLLPIGIYAHRGRLNEVLPEDASPEKDLANLSAFFGGGVALSLPWALGSYFYWTGVQKGAYWPEAYLGAGVAIVWYLLLSPLLERGLAELSARGDPFYKKWHELAESPGKAE